MKRDILLIIDDSELDLAILNEIFKNTFQVKTLSESKEGLEFISQKKDQICAVLLDICLGRKGAGFQVLEKLHAQQEQFPIILITSDANEEYVMDGISQGAADFLVKPVDPHTVQERVCNTVRNAFPEGTTILDTTAETEVENQTSFFAFMPSPVTKNDTEYVAAQWAKRLQDFCQYRTALSMEEYKRISAISSLLAETYVAKYPQSKLTQVDATMIGMAAMFYDIGLLALPDDVIAAGAEQDEPGRNLYFQHLELGKAFFQSNDPQNKFLRYCEEIAYWHHKNFDGSGYPQNTEETEIPISAQIVRTAIRCNECVKSYLGYPDYYERMTRVLSAEINRTISSEMHELIVASESQLVLLMRVLYFGWLT